MARLTLPLSDKEIKNAKSRTTQYSLYDGDGLSLLIMPDKIVKDKIIPGSKLWRLKYRVNGVEKLTSLGKLKNVTLAEAREKRDSIKKKAAMGIDSATEKKKNIEQSEAEAIDTLEAVGREWHTEFVDTWSAEHAAKKLKCLEAEIFKHIGQTHIRDLTALDLLNVLKKIKDRGNGTGNLDLAHRMHGDIRKILMYAIATGRIERNVAVDINGALPPTTYGNRAAFTEPEDVQRLMKAIWRYCGHQNTCAALKLAPMLFVRPGEIRFMEWTEINFETSTWSIPGIKMKMKDPHIVPLPTQAVEILKNIHFLNGDNQYVFPNVLGAKAKHPTISENTLNSALRAMGFTMDEVCSHGFRATARTICDEVLEIRTDFLEHQLAHVVKDPNGTAYNRTKHLAQRRVFMQTWADYLDNLRMS